MKMRFRGLPNLMICTSYRSGTMVPRMALRRGFGGSKGISLIIHQEWT